MLRWLIGKPDQNEVRLPVLGKDHQSSVPGLYIVGDLAGAPTIRIAANQGHEVLHWNEEQARAAEPETLRKAEALESDTMA